MNRRRFMGWCGGGAALVLVGCASSLDEVTLLDMLQQQDKKFLAEYRKLNGLDTIYIVGVKDSGAQEFTLEDPVEGYSWLFYVGDEHRRVLVDKPPSEYLVPPGTRVYVAYEPWHTLGVRGVPF